MQKHRITSMMVGAVVAVTLAGCDNDRNDEPAPTAPSTAVTAPVGNVSVPTPDTSRTSASATPSPSASASPGPTR